MGRERDLDEHDRAVADMAAYNAFADTMLAADPVARRYETHFVKKRRKYVTALPL